MIGVFGGTFDPPHIGHLILAEEGWARLGLSRVLWVLTPVPPHKPDQPTSPLDLRLEMLRAAIRGNTHFEISSADMDRPPPHYAVGTMAWLRRRQPGKRFAYLMGSDSLRDLPSWHEPARFLQQCEALGVMNRPQREADLAALEEQLPGVREKAIFFDAPLVSVSGRGIRRRVREGSPYRYLVPQAVAQIIRRSGLYQ